MLTLIADNWRSGAAAVNGVTGSQNRTPTVQLCSMPTWLLSENRSNCQETIISRQRAYETLTKDQ